MTLSSNAKPRFLIGGIDTTTEKLVVLASTAVGAYFGYRYSTSLGEQLGMQSESVTAMALAIVVGALLGNLAGQLSVLVITKTSDIFLPDATPALG